MEEADKKTEIVKITEIVQECYGEIWEYFKRNVPNGNDADDLTQDLFTRFVRHCTRHGLPADPVAYLWKCVYHRRNDYYKAGSPVGPLPDDGSALEAAALGPAALVENDEQWDILLRAINDSLKEQPYKQSACFQMRYFAGYSHKEIAAKLGIPVNSVGGYLARARKEVADHLRRHQP